MKKKTTALALATLVGTSTLLNGVPTVVFAQDNTDIIIDDSIQNKEQDVITNNFQNENKEKNKTERTDWNIASETDTEIVLGEYIGSSKDIVIPSEIEGKQVYVKLHSTSFPRDMISLTIPYENGKKVKVKGTDLSTLFWNYGKVQRIDVSGLDITGVTRLGDYQGGRRLGMFTGCEFLTSIIGLENWDVSSVINMEAMFSRCASLKKINGIENWDVSKVENMLLMFDDCKSLEDISTLKYWNTSSVTNMEAMFWNCKKLKDLTPLADWDVSKVTNMSSMFQWCPSITDLTGLEDWDVSSVTDVSNMFSQVNIKNPLPLKNWNVSSVIDMSEMFRGCRELNSLTGLEGWNVSSVENMQSMFSGWNTLNDITALEKWDVSAVTNMGYMFAQSRELKDVSILNNWSVLNVESMSQMFEGCYSLTAVDLSNWETPRLENISSMFRNCPDLKVIDLSQFVLDNIGESWRMNEVFYNDDKTPLLVIAKDERLKQYDYNLDNRLAIGPIFNANGGNFSDGTVEKSSIKVNVIENRNSNTINTIIENAKNTIETPTKVGDVFAGWSENTMRASNRVNEELLDAYNKINTSFFAQWGNSQYVVNFDTQGGTIVQIQTVRSGSYISEPKSPTRKGYTFMGWYKEEECLNKWNFEIDKMPANNITLYAKWILNSSSINHAPTINATDKVLTVGDAFNPLDGVTAHDTEDGNITLTEANIIANDVDMSQAGTYNITYKVTDKKGASSIKTITVVVNPKLEVLNHIPTINATDKVLTVGDTFNPLDGVTAHDTEDGDITLTEANIIANNVDMSQAGTYSVTYKVTDSKGASTVKTITVVVNPKMEVLNHIPTINATDKVLTVGDTFNPLDGVTAHDKEDGDITLTEANIIANNVDMSQAGTYSVTYKVTDSKGASTVKTITVTVNEKATIPVEKPDYTTTSKPDKLPLTGDVSNLGLLGLMFAGSGGMLLGLNRKNRKK